MLNVYLIIVVAMKLSTVYIINCRGVAQSGSAPRLGRGGRRFESSRPDQPFLFSFKGLREIGKGQVTEK